MKETHLHVILQKLEHKINVVEQRSSLGVTSEAIRNQALYKLLVKKGLLTEQEFIAEVGDVIKEMNNPKPEEAKVEEAPKPEIIAPSAEQIQTVEQSVVEEPK